MIGVDCPEVNDGTNWIIGDKKLSWDSLPIIDDFERPEGAEDFILFEFDEGRWTVALLFDPNSQYGGPTNNTLTDGRVVRNPVTGNVAEAAWTYTLNILDPDLVFDKASAGADLGVGSETAFFDVVKDVAWNGSVTPINLNEGQPNPAVPVSIFGATSVTTTLDWGSCPNCSFIVFTDTYTQITPSKVPGPLPVLGAAAAFGYSRRLRNRIRLHRPEARIEA